MTQENIIGNNQAQKINSVRPEIGVGDKENCGACALTRAGRVSSVCVCVCVCVCVRARVIVCEKCKS
jgi:hypothetical protein